jgi:hypothetical protein
MSARLVRDVCGFLPGQLNVVYTHLWVPMAGIEMFLFVKQDNLSQKKRSYHDEK